MKTAVIFGSSRNEGNTSAIVKKLIDATDWDLINLNDFDMSYYDYDHKNRNDDFIPLMKRISEKYDTLVFATPVYWYSMSAVMKVFFDRLSDLLSIEKDLGRTLRGKKMATITSSDGGNLGEHFFLPFKESANYLGMTFITGVHTVSNENSERIVEEFINTVNKSLKYDKE